MGAGFLESILMRPRHQFGAVAAPAQRWTHPQAADQHPSTPDVAQQSAENFAAMPSDEKSYRIVVREPGHRDVVLIDAANDGLRPCLGRVGLRYDVHFAHVRSSYQAAACIANGAGAYLKTGLRDDA